MDFLVFKDCLILHGHVVTLELVVIGSWRTVVIVRVRLGRAAIGGATSLIVINVGVANEHVAFIESVVFFVNYVLLIGRSIA